MANNSYALQSMIGYVKIVVRLVSWLSAHLTSWNHNLANLHPVLEIKVSKSKLGLYLSYDKQFIVTLIFKADLQFFKLVSILWGTMYFSQG